MEKNAYCTSGESPGNGEGGDKRLTTNSSLNPIELQSSLSDFFKQDRFEELKESVRRLSRLGLHPETIRRELDTYNQLLLRMFLENQLKLQESILAQDRNVESDDLKVAEIIDTRFYNVEQIEKSFKKIVNLESLRQNGLVTRGGWTLGSTLRRALERFFEKGSVNNSDSHLGEGHETRNQTPRLCSQRNQKRMAGHVGGTSKDRNKIYTPRGSNRHMDDELANFRSLRAGKGSIQKKKS